MTPSLPFLRFRIAPRGLWFVLAGILVVSCALAQGGGTGRAGLPGGGRFTRLNTDDGLPTNDIRSIAQDHQGFIWLGTADAGLCRFDGYEIRRFVHDPADPTSLSHNFIWALLVDRFGTVWIGTAGGGLDRYDPKTGTFLHLQNQPGDPGSLPHNTVLSLHEDHAGVLWVGTRGGLSRYERETGRFTTFARAADARIGPNLNSVRCITGDAESGLLWLGTSDSLCAFDPRAGVFTTVLRPIEGLVPTGFNSVNTVIKDRDGWFWVGTERGLLRFQSPARLLAENAGGIVFADFEVHTHRPGDPTSLPAEYIREARLDRQGRLWLATQDGLAAFDPRSGQCRSFRNHPGDPESIGANVCHRVFEDAAGNLWVTSQHNGVSRLNAWAKEFRSFRRILGEADTLCHDTVTALLVAADGALWAGTVDGLSRFDGSGWRTYRHVPDDPASLSSNGIAALAQDGSGRIWVGTNIAGICRLEADGRFTRFLRRAGDPGPTHLARLAYTHNQISTLMPAARGGVWVGARSWGLDLFEDGAFLHRATTDAEGRRQPVDFAVFGHETGDGRLFYGTEQWGLVELDRATGAMTVHLPEPGNAGSPLNKYITTVYSDDGDTVWLGSINGLFRFSLAQRVFTLRLTRSDGLPADSVVSIVADRAGLLWVGTAAGLAQVDGVRGAVVRVFDRADGLASNQLAPRAAAVGPEGRVYVGTTAGITSFDPGALHINEVPPPVVITDVEVSGRGAHQADGSSGRARLPWSRDPARLGPGRTSIIVRFAALDFTAPARNRYRYRLEGYDQEWHETDAANRHATYTNLPAGLYVFRVLGSNNDGRWSETPAVVEFEILRAWWATAWFRGGCALAVAGAILAGFRLRIRAIARRNAQLERQVVERTRELEVARDQAEAASRAKSTFLATMSHELRTPLNSVLGYTQRIQSDPDMASRHGAALATIRQSGEHLLALINDVLDLSRIVAGRLELLADDFELPRFLRGIADIMRVRVEEKDLRFAVELDRDLPGIVRGDPTRLRQVLLNLLGNAVRYTDRGVVSFRVRRLAGAGGAGRVRLGFEIEDTGVGMSADQVARLFRPFEQVGDGRHRTGGAGLGLAITRQLVELMGGRIDVMSVPGRGSRFSFGIEVEVSGPSRSPDESAGPVVGYVGVRRKVRVIDSLGPRRAALADMLQALDFRVIETGVQAEVPPGRDDALPDLVIEAVETGPTDTVSIRGADGAKGAVPRILIADVAEVRASSEGARVLRRPVEMPALLAAIAEALGLTWIRGTVPGVPDGDAASPPAAPFAAPPAAEIEALWALALRGDMRGVRERAERLAALGPAHRPLAEHLKALASDYKSRAILATIRQFGRLGDKS
ncbi:MAG: hypothetical protein IAE82_09180 [Opitutaceae bacterium]|nr:hypothetical protein [Opitutaceae bacterium]